MAAQKNGDDRAATIKEYLAEAERCEHYAQRAEQDEERKSWEDLAKRWRTLAAILRGEEPPSD
ncbi:hypothetical protein GJW-30_1_03647 [Variibacter gotjawalensis]|uniref:Uncharacterized protein n=1 Tax=Variibacter gotjawalensis TaxID=1333996 RepID=A0A0S3PYS3_9BRAD|nr:hypothetical protein [Variibacter gotjawalensis]NIK46930.1 hypothetical protein [Variibacter gotjawalensis]RZS48834.1 hypothetical protein EV661_1254 [Variibacter gotjawalensis]BAT61093.1 hypothetical protein GJW-30_1_03647 [Variibacter gotjawalensis]